MSETLDSKSFLSAEDREVALFADLPEKIASAKLNSGHYAKLFAGIDEQLAANRANLCRFPITRKSSLPEQQKKIAPFGGINCIDAGDMVRVFQSPGPLYEPQTAEQDYWRMGQAFYAAGFRAGELVHNTLSYHFSPGGFIMDSGARACGCAVFPAGVGNTDAQIEAIKQLRPTGYSGTPSYLIELLSRYKQADSQPCSINKAMVSGEPVTAEMQQEFQRNGIRVYQAYATAELGLIAYQAEGEQGLIVAEDIIVEVVDPEGYPVPEGDVGEVVVTTLNSKFPLIRFATGDLSAKMPIPKESSRTNTRLKGWLGRADSAVKVKGLFVYPHQVEEICRRHNVKGSLKIERQGHKDSITFFCQQGDSSVNDIQSTLQSVTKLKGEVLFMPAGMPNELPLIDDKRQLVT